MRCVIISHDYSCVNKKTGLAERRETTNIGFTEGNRIHVVSPVTAQCRASVCDAGPALGRHWADLSVRLWTPGGCVSPPFDMIGVTIDFSPGPTNLVMKTDTCLAEWGTAFYIARKPPAQSMQRSNYV